MRNSLLSIGEASRLKNVSIKALRYYEKIGIFKPKYIDPQSGYRYYSPAQLFDLDVILTCSELDIPLKHLLDYQTTQGTIDLKKLLKEGAHIAERKMQRAQQSLIQINSCLEEIEEQTKHRSCRMRYTRTLNFSSVYAKPWDSSKPFEIKHYLKTMSDLYQQAEHLGFTPLYFQGLLIDSTDDLKCSAYVSVEFYPTTLSDAKKSLAFSHPNDPEGNFYHLSKTTYRGFRIESSDLSECINQALTYTKTHPGFYVMTEIWDAELAANTYVIELLQSGKILDTSVSD